MEIKDLEHQLIEYKINDLKEHAEIHSNIKLIKYEFTDIDMKEIIKEPLELISGRGGGSPFATQGGGNNIDNANLALETAYKHINSLLK